MIKVYDNIIPSNLSKNIKNHIFGEDGLQRMPFYFVSDLTSKTDINLDYGFGSNLLINENYDVSKGKSMLLTPLLLLSIYKNFFINNIILARTYIQLPTLNPGPQIKHTDLDYPHLVCLYYVNDSDGDTIFFDDNDNEIKRISPKEGRIALFNGNIKHCGSKPSTFPRSVINICFNTWQNIK